MVQAYLIYIPIVSVVGGAAALVTSAVLGAVAGKHRERKKFARMALDERRGESVAADRMGERRATLIERKGHTPNGEEVVVVRRE